MKRVLKQCVIVFFSSGLIACAGTSQQDDSVANRDVGRRGDCILESSIRGYSVLDEQNLIVDVLGRRSYHVTLFTRAHGLSSSWGIGFSSRTSRVCAGFDEIVFNGSFGDRRETIRISSIRELTPEEEEDLLIQFGKKEPEIEQTPEPQEVEGADVEELDTATSE